MEGDDGWSWKQPLRKVETSIYYYEDQLANEHMEVEDNY